MPAFNRSRLVLDSIMRDSLQRATARSKMQCDPHTTAQSRSLPRKLVRRTSTSPVALRRRAADHRTVPCSNDEFTAHSSNVTCLALGHKSGRVMVTGGDDRKVNLWSVGKPNCIMSLGGHMTPIECVRFGHTEELVCAGSVSGALKIWDLEAARLLRTLTGHKSNIRCVDFHPYGDFLASGSLDTNIKLWDTRRKGCIFTYKGHKQMVNSLKFSPDGQWIVSAGEDSGVKIWDIRAGKLLTEFSRHVCAVSDVEFHPHEFLMASAGADRVVNFWDLENFQLVSSSDASCASAVRCVSFSSDGECLFAGCHDLLRVYGWEPFRCYDSVHMGWGRVADIALSQTQLVGAAFQGACVSVYLVDLNQLQPYYKPPAGASDPAPFQPRQSMRKSFIRKKPADKDTNRLSVKSEDLSDANQQTDAEEDASASVHVQNVTDYAAIFQPRNRHLSRTPPPLSLSPPSSDFPQLDSVRPPAPPDSQQLVSADSGQLPTASTATEFTSLSSTLTASSAAAATTADSVPPQRTLPPVTVPPHLPSPTGPGSIGFPSHDVTGDVTLLRNTTSYLCPSGRPVRHSADDPVLSVSSTLSSHFTSLPFQSAQCHSPTASTSSPTAATSPLTAVPPPQAAPPPDLVPPCATGQLPSPHALSAYHHHHQQQHSTVIVPMTTDKPSGLAVDDFLPQKLTALGFVDQRVSPSCPSLLPAAAAAGGGASLLSGRHSALAAAASAAAAVGENDMLGQLAAAHTSMMAVLTHRLRQLEIGHAVWCNKDARTALEQLIERNDLAVIIDLLGQLNFRPSIWNLDICQVVLPIVPQLLQSSYETYMAVACATLALVLKNFSAMIKTNLASPVYTHGVDISREERYNKCKACYDELLVIRASLQKRQTLQGKLGRTFRELLIQMQTFD